mmetsp:Transcript_110767/g.345214  ORF Transcript_110767/g.345214 Transcript_110767/m.345214 type:complete len:217 (+) Transcript_110767:147-797(+)
MGHALYLAHGGQAPQPGEYCTVHLGTVEGGRAVYLHCGHSFCLRPCFWNLCRHGFTKCPTCWTPLVVMSPDFRYFDALLSALVPRRSARLEGMAHVSKLRQFRQFHDGSLRPEAWTAEVGLYTDALSHSDFLTQVRRACVSCPFAQYGFRPRSSGKKPKEQEEDPGPACEPSPLSPLRREPSGVAQGYFCEPCSPLSSSATPGLRLSCGCPETISL